MKRIVECESSRLAKLAKLASLPKLCRFGQERVLTESDKHNACKLLRSGNGELAFDLVSPSYALRASAGSLARAVAKALACCAKFELWLAQPEIEERRLVHPT